MKKIILIFIVLFISCTLPTAYDFVVEVKYQDGNMDTIRFRGQCCQLDNMGCIYGGYVNYYPVCGVRSFRIISKK